MIKYILISQIYFLILNFIFIIIIQSIPSHNYKTHPLILISILFILLIISIINIRIIITNHWFSFIRFLIIIGGIIIIFIYFIRFINNIKTSIKLTFLKKFHIKFLIFIIFIVIYIITLKYNFWNTNFNEINSIFISINKNNNNLIILYLFPKRLTTLISILYLLVCLTIIVKICLNKKLTLRKFNYEKIYYKN